MKDYSFVKNSLQACTGILQPNFAKEQFSLFKLFQLSCILVTIGLMIAIKKKRHIENNVNKNGPKNLDSFWLNSVLFGIAIYSNVFVRYLKGWELLQITIRIRYVTVLTVNMYSFQNITRKLAQIPSLAIIMHTWNHSTSDCTFGNCYEDIDEKRNETISLWK